MRALLLIALTACSGQPARNATGSTAPIASSAPPPAFAPPSVIGDCRSDRLDVRHQAIDAGGPHRPFQSMPMELFVQLHSHLVGGVVVVLIPSAAPGERVTAIEARRFVVAKGTWLPPAKTALGGQPQLAPRFGQIDSAVVRGQVVVRWNGAARKFSVSSGRWSNADPALPLPGRNGLARHAAYPPNPDPTTGVLLEVSGETRTLTFSRAGQTFGTIRLVARPGAYIGAFANTRTALLWSNQTDAAKRIYPPAERYETYLVGLETGATCRVPRELALPATAVFRTKNAIVTLHALRTESEPSNCPPGAPCVAPQPSHFRAMAITTFRDRGP